MANNRKVEIYHLIDNEANYPIMFRSYEWAQKKGIKITHKLYQKVYSCERQRNYPLEAIFQEFNLNHPADYQAHSLLPVPRFPHPPKIPDISIRVQLGVPNSGPQLPGSLLPGSRLPITRFGYSFS